MASELLVAAQDYLQRGLSVIALSGKMPNGKVHPHGLYDAFHMDEAGYSASYLDAFMHPRTTGIGILTNYPYFVIDIDGEEGAVQWREIVGDDWISDRWVAKTGRGLHIWYADDKPRTTRKLGPKLDLKADGGYVAAPPSLHPNGDTYFWILEPGDLPPIEAPGALTKLLDEQDWQRDRRIAGKGANRRIRHAQFTDGKWWATWGFDGLLKAVTEAKEGSRNAVLHWAAYVMAEDGADDEDYDQLRDAALTVGLTARETRLTIRSARRAASGE